MLAIKKPTHYLLLNPFRKKEPYSIYPKCFLGRPCHLVFIPHFGSSLRHFCFVHWFYCDFCLSARCFEIALLCSPGWCPTQRSGCWDLQACCTHYHTWLFFVDILVPKAQSVPLRYRSCGSEVFSLYSKSLLIYL